MDNKSAFLRYASPNERRTITRENVGFYRSVAIGAVYEFEDAKRNLNSLQWVYDALKICIAQHPSLAAIVKGWETEKPFYERTMSIDVKNHVEILNSEGDNQSDKDTIEKVLPIILDRSWREQPREVPRWRIDILPLSSHALPASSRFLIVFAFSHTLGDGVSGLAFHRSFLEALQNSSTTVDQDPGSSVIKAPIAPIAAPFDTSSRLPISWSYLLAPLLAVYLPKAVASFFGFRAAVGAVDEGTWTGPNIFFDEKKFDTRVSLLDIDAALVNRALRTAKSNGAKLTAVFHGLILRALSNAITVDGQRNVTNFVSLTAINMRPSIRASDDEMGLFVSTYPDLHDRVDGRQTLTNSSDNIQFWKYARDMTFKIAEHAATLQDQAIGLLRFLPSMRKWTVGKIGQRRDDSYEISNLGAFNPIKSTGATDTVEAKAACAITKMVFSQPASVSSSPLVFNLISVKGGNLVCTVNWQIGALGVPEAEEKTFVDGICQHIQHDLETLA